MVDRPGPKKLYEQTMAEPRIEYQGAGKRYGKLWALRDLNVAFHPGEVVMVIGPNGSGKTTMIKCLLGLVRPTEGVIRVNGTIIGKDPGYRKAIGYMPQISQFPAALTIGQLLDMMRDIRELDDDLLEDSLVEELGLDKQLDKRLSELSGGTRQKVSAVLAFRSRPEILVMDEPTAGSGSGVRQQGARARTRCAGEKRNGVDHVAPDGRGGSLGGSGRLHGGWSTTVHSAHRGDPAEHGSEALGQGAA